MKNWALPAILVVLIAGVGVGVMILRDTGDRESRLKVLGANSPLGPAANNTGASAQPGVDTGLKSGRSSNSVPDLSRRDSATADKGGEDHVAEPTEGKTPVRRAPAPQSQLSDQSRDNRKAERSTVESKDQARARRLKVLEIPPELRRARPRSTATVDYPVDRPVPSSAVFRDVGAVQTHVQAHDLAPGEKVLVAFVYCFSLSGTPNMDDGRQELFGNRIEVWNDRDPTVWLAQQDGEEAAIFHIPFREEAIWFFRASSDDMVGTSMLSTRALARATRLGGGLQNLKQDSGIFRANVQITMFPKAPSIVANIRVQDVNSTELTSAVFLLGSAVLARADENGRLEVPRVVLPATFRGNPGYLGLSNWGTVHAPGYLPRFYRFDQMDQIGNTVVQLHKEVQVSFKAPLTASEQHFRPLYENHDPSINAIPSELDLMDWISQTPRVQRSLKTEWPRYGSRPNFAPDSPFTPGFDKFAESLAALGIEDSGVKAAEYAFWYTGQYDYNADTETWTVSLPYQGRFYVNICDKHRLDPADSNTQVPYLDLAIDATDPKNPRGYLIRTEGN